VIEDINRGIETAQIVIAEITPKNENVFYEVGYAHALKKPTILLVDMEKKKELPFDLSSYRCLFYQNSIGGKRKVEEALRKYLQTILDE
jgi:nucleoside 2-deoxyribosyltransferase